MTSTDELGRAAALLHREATKLRAAVHAVVPVVARGVWCGAAADRLGDEFTVRRARLLAAADRLDALARRLADEAERERATERSGAP
ncbi:MAG TPA: hypothetical protein VHF25_16765 [Nitriliruptorales bacterium]|nr:hypothetical protein [Nitriliruptorales bacterium]